MVSKVHFSSTTDEWSTPQWLFDELNAEFKFDLDVCATPENAKCAKYYTKDLASPISDIPGGCGQIWKADGSSVWCNPPYGREIWRWVYMCSQFPHEHELMLERRGVAVMLLPARTDTKWFHQWIYKNEDAEIRFLKGRLKFGGAKNSAPFPSCIVIFR